MNISIDERTKHRLTGLIVVLAVAIIFVPAMVKKSNQRLEENIHVSVQLPPKPSAPKVAVADKQAVFDTVKVAQVELPPLKEPAHVSHIARAEGLQFKTPVKKQVRSSRKPVIAKASVKSKTIKYVQAPSNKLENDMREAYAVQLASFTSQDNAEKLVYRLRDHGYKAQYQTTTQGNNALYKVIVGQLDDRDDAHALKEKLSESLQLNGFVVKRSVNL
ncbi:MAG: SPOR domain-containing protein [Legionellaceae bacterium]|nr:SPOR domain-containing protein [Legionellaceae bacterium]